MFDIDFSELIVIALVALVVIGPERLPRVARTAGALLGRFQRYVNEVKTEVRREMEIEDLKKLQSQVAEQMREMESTIRAEAHAAGAAVHDVAHGAAEEKAAATKTAETQAVEAEVAAPAAHDKPSEKTA